jgi:hypothetical protein
MRYLKIVFLFIIFLSTGKAVLNAAVLTNQGNSLSNNLSTNALVFENEIDLQSADPDKNIVFDNYDEVVMQNFDKKNITQIKFIGNVRIRFDKNALKARTVIVTTSSNKVLEITAYEKVEFRYEGNIYLSDSLSFNPSTKKGVLKNVRSFLKEGASQAGPLSSSRGWYYHAKKVSLLSSDRIVLEKVYFTFTPAELPHYQFYSERLWYFKGEVIYALSDTYTVGQANFVWFPFFLEWEKFTGLKTSFGIEKRIGWYLMNSFSLKQDYGAYDFGLDVYERLGQYFTLNFNNSKPLGPFSAFNLAFQGANDTRVFHDSARDRYTQVVNVNGSNMIIQQLSWYYKTSATLDFKDSTFTFYWEDLNDPFFTSKYSQRRTKLDVIKEVIQPENNSFFSHDDTSPSVSSISRGFNFKQGTLDINGKLVLQRYENSAVSNSYLNDYYKFQVSEIQLPNISYSLGRKDLFKDLNYSVPVSKTLQISNKSYGLPMEEDVSNYVEMVSRENSPTNSSYWTNSENEFSTKNIENLSNSKIETPHPDFNPDASSTDTNFSLTSLPETRYSLITNQFTFYNFSSYISADVKYNSDEFVDTNMKPTSDSFSHNENASIGLDGLLINNLFSFNNSINYHNTKIWSTFSNVQYNNQLSSGYEINYQNSSGFNKSGALFTNTFWEINFPFSINNTYTYQLARTIYSYLPRQSSDSTSLAAGFNMFSQNLVYALSLSHSITYRLTNDIIDDYKDNMIARSFTAGTSLKIFWLSADTSFSLDVLETKSRPIYWSYDGFTNRLPSPNMRVNFTFQPPGELQPLPTISYVYDIIQKTNVSFDISSSYLVKSLYGFIFYKTEVLNFNSSLHWDFLNPRSTSFGITFSTTLWFDPYWKLTFSTGMRNTQIYRYFYENAAIFNEPYVEFWQNLKDSLNVFDYQGLKRGFFKVQAFHFDLTHYLNEWEMHMVFDLNRRVDNLKLISFWEPTIRIEFMLSGTQEQFPPFEKKFVPAQYQ